MQRMGRSALQPAIPVVAARPVASYDDSLQRRPDVDILGISAFYHDSAACLIREGEIIAAAQEERFSRKNTTRVFQFMLFSTA